MQAVTIQRSPYGQLDITCEVMAEYEIRGRLKEGKVSE